MYGSYGSYSSMSIGSAPMNIYTSVTSRDESCAFPSWPRRSSLSSSNMDDVSHEPRASSYLSDDDLFLDDEPSSSGSESDDLRSVSSAGSASPPTLGLVLASPVRAAPSEAEILEMQRQRLNVRKDLIRMVQQEKERRKQQASKSRRSTAAAAAASKKSSGKTTMRNNYTMAPIKEADE